MDIVLILLPSTWASFPANPGPAASVALAQLNVKPGSGPYMEHWPPNTAFANQRYYWVEWNKHLVVNGWQLNCNDILRELNKSFIKPTLLQLKRNKSLLSSIISVFSQKFKIVLLFNNSICLADN